MAHCDRCDDTGQTITTMRGVYVGPGILPDYARNFVNVECGECPSRDPCQLCAGEGSYLPAGSGDEKYETCPDCDGTGEAE